MCEQEYEEDKTQIVRSSKETEEQYDVNFRPHRPREEGWGLERGRRERRRAGAARAGERVGHAVPLVLSLALSLSLSLS